MTTEEEVTMTDAVEVTTGMTTGEAVTEGMKMTGIVTGTDIMTGDTGIGEITATDHMVAGAYRIQIYPNNRISWYQLKKFLESIIWKLQIEKFFKRNDIDFFYFQLVSWRMINWTKLALFLTTFWLSCGRSRCRIRRIAIDSFIQNATNYSRDLKINSRFNSGVEIFFTIFFTSIWLELFQGVTFDRLFDIRKYGVKKFGIFLFLDLLYRCDIIAPWKSLQFEKKTKIVVFTQIRKKISDQDSIRWFRIDLIQYLVK